MVHFFGGGFSPSSAGVIVNRATALQISAVFACVQVIADDIASLPWPLFEQVDERVKQRAKTHPLYSLLHDQPNEEMTSFEFRQTLMMDALLQGNGLAEIERNGAGRPVALWPLDVGKTTLERHPQSGALAYWTEHRITRQQVPLPFRNVFHIKALGNGLWGLSVVEHARRTFGIAAAREEYAARFYGNSARPDGFLSAEGRLDKDARERLRESWNEAHQGPSQAHKVAVLPPGIKWEKLNLSPQEVQFLETGKFSVEDIARWFRVKPSKIQHLEQSSVRANIEEANIEHITDTLMPWIVRIEQQANWKLLAPAERGRLFTKLIAEGKLRGDFEKRTKGYQSAILSGWMTPNEARELEDRNPFTGGDIHLVPLNTQPIEAASGQPPRRPTADDARALQTRANLQSRQLLAAHRNLLLDTAERILHKETNALERAGRRLLEGGSLEEFRAWAGPFYREHAGFVTRALHPVLAALGTAVYQTTCEEEDVAADTAALERSLADYSQEAGRRWAERSLQLLETAADYASSPATLAAALERQADAWQRQRPGEVADWHGSTVVEMGIRAALQAAGVKVQPASPEQSRRGNGQEKGASA